MEWTILVGVFVLAFLTESLVEYLLSDLFEAVGAPRGLLKYPAAAVGVVLAVLYRIDLLQAYFGLQPVNPLVGQVLTGLIIGRGSNYVHDLAKRYIWSKPGPEML